MANRDAPLDRCRAQAPMTISALVNGDYIPVWIGSGSYHVTQLVEPGPDGGYLSTLCMRDGELRVASSAKDALESFLRAGIRWFATDCGAYRVSTVETLSC